MRPLNGRPGAYGWSGPRKCGPSLQLTGCMPAVSLTIMYQRLFHGTTLYKFTYNSIQYPVQTRCPAVYICAWESAATIPRRRVPPVFGSRGSGASSLSVIIVTDRPSYTVVDCRPPSFSGRRCSCLERTTT